MSGIINYDERHKKLSSVIKYGLAAIVCLAVSPIIFMVVKGAVGLVVAGVIGATAIALAPAVGYKLASWKLKAIKQDAMANPVETRQQIEMETQKKLEAFLKSIAEFETEVLTFKDKVMAMQRKYPNKPEVQDNVKRLQSYEQLLAVRKKKWDQARADLQAYKAETIEISDLWDLAQAGLKMGQKSGNVDMSAMDELRTRVANDAVHRQMNAAMSQLSTVVLEETPVGQLGFSSAEILEFPATSVKEVSRVPNHSN